MDTITGKLIAAGILAIFTLISGIILSHSGKPLNIWLTTIHKLIAVATVVLVVMIVNQLMKSNGDSKFLTFSLMFLSAVLFLALIATGAFLTREEMELPSFVLKIHQVAPLLALASSSATIALMFLNKA
jgi:heme A synthase